MLHRSVELTLRLRLNSCAAADCRDVPGATFAPFHSNAALGSFIGEPSGGSCRSFVISMPVLVPTAGKHSHDYIWRIVWSTDGRRRMSSVGYLWRVSTSQCLRQRRFRKSGLNDQ